MLLGFENFGMKNLDHGDCQNADWVENLIHLDHESADEESSPVEAMCAMDSHNVQRVLSNVLPVVICYNMQESKYVIICCKIGSGKGLNVEAS